MQEDLKTSGIDLTLQACQVQSAEAVDMPVRQLVEEYASSPESAEEEAIVERDMTPILERSRIEDSVNDSVKVTLTG